MNQPLNAHEIAKQLAERSRELDEVVSQLDEAEREAINRREDHTQAYAKAFLAAQGAMDIRRHIATENTHESRLAAELAEQHVRALNRQVQSVRTRIDVGRTLGATVRAEVSLGGSGQP